MTRTIGSIALLVRDYDEAIAFYTQALGFTVLEDSTREESMPENSMLENSRLGDVKRWVRVAPPGGNGTALLLARAANDAQRARIGDQTGGRVGFFLHTDDFRRDHAAMTARGVRFTEAPRTEAYGTVAVFQDLYGNRWDLLELDMPAPDTLERAP